MPSSLGLKLGVEELYTAVDAQHGDHMNLALQIAHPQL